MQNLKISMQKKLQLVCCFLLSADLIVFSELLGRNWATNVNADYIFIMYFIIFPFVSLVDGL